MHNIARMVVCSAVAVCLSGQTGSSHIHGQIETGGDAGRYWVELAASDRTGPPQRAPSENDGSFEFRSVPAGEYSLRITTLLGEPVHEQRVNFRTSVETLTIRLQQGPRARPISGLVSVQDLKIPKKAMQSFLRAQQYMEAGKPADATQSLQDAIRRYPEFSQAHANLGVQYIREARYGQAAQEFELALKSNASDPVVVTNYAFSQLMLGHTTEAHQNVRRALELDPEYPRGHYLLGVILSDQGKLAEAIPHLREGAKHVQASHLRLAHTYLRTGDRPAAVMELRQYLAVPNAPKRPEVERWLASIQKAP